MRTADRIGAAILLALAVAYTATAAGRYTYWTATGPGSGFFPFWLGLVLAVLSTLLLVSAVRRPDPGAAWLPTGHGAARPVVVVLVTAAFIALLPLLGMVLGTAVFLTVLLKKLEGHSWRATLAVAVGAAVANWAIFVLWLNVPFPVGVLGFCAVDLFTNLALGFSVAFTPFNLLMAFLGVILGTLIGALPGIGPVSGVALLLPITFGMHPTSGIIMLAALYTGSMYGGTITSVLINTPGESASVVTCIDGYQMALQGRAGPALGMAALGSFIAGTVGVVFLMAMSPLLARWALSFGPPETFALMLLGLTTVTGLTGENAVKGYISMVLGLMMSMVGFDIISGDQRYTGGITEMLDGFDFLPVAIGLFGMGEVLAGAEDAARSQILSARYGLRDVLPTAADWVRSRWAIVRGTVLGFVIGVLPGAGPTIASFLAYTVEKKISARPQDFGRGAIEGVAAPESANNAASAGAMVPMLTLGIPGSATTAVMLGGLMMWGIRPGPLLFEKNPDFVWGLIASLYIANVMLVILNIGFIPVFVRALRIPYSILMPLIIVFCITGAYSLNNKVWDVGQMLVFGVLGYAMKKLDYSPAAMTLALVLGPLAERSLRQALIISDAGVLILFQRPIAAVLTTLALIAVAVPAARALRGAMSARKAAAVS